nr:MAG TPA: hypothetical protein [Caudoviricetes sp.]
MKLLHVGSSQGHNTVFPLNRSGLYSKYPPLFLFLYLLGGCKIHHSFLSWLCLSLYF